MLVTWEDSEGRQVMQSGSEKQLDSQIPVNAHVLAALYELVYSTTQSGVYIASIQKSCFFFV